MGKVSQQIWGGIRTLVSLRMPTFTQEAVGWWGMVGKTWVREEMTCMEWSWATCPRCTFPNDKTRSQTSAQNLAGPMVECWKGWEKLE